MPNDTACPPEPDSGRITRLLRDWRDGDEQAAETLSTLIYRRLHDIAVGQMRRESREVTLQPTALVHEVVLQMLGDPPDCTDREHLFALSGRMMRNFLVNEAKKRLATKRGGDVLRVELDESLVGDADPDIEMLALHQAFEQLAERDPRKHELLELHYFGGLSYDEMARVTGISRASVHRELRMARAFVAARLGAGADG